MKTKSSKASILGKIFAILMLLMIAGPIFIATINGVSQYVKGKSQQPQIQFKS